MILTYIILSRGIIRSQPVADIGPAKAQITSAAKYGQGIATVSSGTAFLVNPTHGNLQPFRELLRSENIPRLKPGLNSLHAGEFWRCCHLAQGLKASLAVAAVVLEYMKVQARAIGFVKITEQFQIWALVFDGLLRQAFNDFSGLWDKEQFSPAAV
jgi:hypothetical protein